jgi:hypothetical protein
MKILIHILVAFLLSYSVLAEDVFKLNQEIDLVIKTKKINSDKRKVTLNGFSKVGNTLFFSDFDPPHEIIDAISVTFNNQKVFLDVSGLSCNGASFEKKDFRVRMVNKDTFWIDIYISSGGVSDYVVTWLISNNTSIRYAICPSGDAPPEWYR